jgi:hypothetical protein
MAAKAFQITTPIWRSLLIFGLIENRNKIISSKELTNLLDFYDHQQIGKYINRYLRQWMPDLEHNAIKAIKGKGYKFNKEFISPNQYSEFVYVLLILNSLEDELWNSEAANLGDSALGIIAALIVAKRKNIFINIKYRVKNTNNNYSFKPKKLFYKKGVWNVEGEFQHTTTKISNIIKINRIQEAILPD